MSNLSLDKLVVDKMSFSNSSSDFCFFSQKVVKVLYFTFDELTVDKKWVCQTLSLAIFLYWQTIFWGWVHRGRRVGDRCWKVLLHLAKQ